MVSDGSCEITEFNGGLKRIFSFSHIRDYFRFYPIFAKNLRKTFIHFTQNCLRKDKKRTKMCVEMFPELYFHRFLKKYLSSLKFS